MNDFIRSVNAVLKYSHETVVNLLNQLHNRPETRLPQPNGSDAANNEHTLFRNVLADAVAESDRPRRDVEESLLRNPDQHVIVHEGQVRPGRYTDGHHRREWRNLRDVVGDWSGYTWQWPFDTDWSENRTPTGDGSVGMLHSQPNDEPSFHSLRYHEVGPHLAGLIHDDISHNGYGWNETDHRGTLSPATHEMRQREYDTALDRLRTAPYEVVDRKHPTEQKVENTPPPDGIDHNKTKL